MNLFYPNLRWPTTLSIFTQNAMSMSWTSRIPIAGPGTGTRSRSRCDGQGDRRFWND